MQIKTHKLASNQSGLGMVGVLFMLILIGPLVYVGWKVLPMYYSFWEIEGLIQQQAKKANERSDEEIRGAVVRTIRDLEIPVDDIEEDLKINRFSGTIVVELYYEEVLDIEIGDYYKELKVFQFHPRAEGEVSERSYF